MEPVAERKYELSDLAKASDRAKAEANAGRFDSAYQALEDVKRITLSMWPNGGDDAYNPDWVKSHIDYLKSLKEMRDSIEDKERTVKLVDFAASEALAGRLEEADQLFTEAADQAKTELSKAYLDLQRMVVRKAGLYALLDSAVDISSTNIIEASDRLKKVLDYSSRFKTPIEPEAIERCIKLIESGGQLIVAKSELELLELEAKVKEADLKKARSVLEGLEEAKVYFEDEIRKNPETVLVNVPENADYRNINPYRFVSIDKEPTQIIPSEEDLIWSDAGQFFSNEDSLSQTDEHKARELFTPTISEPDSDEARKAVEKYFEDLK